MSLLFVWSDCWCVNLDIDISGRTQADLLAKEEVGKTYHKNNSDDYTEKSARTTVISHAIFSAVVLRQAQDACLGLISRPCRPLPAVSRLPHA